MSLIVAALISLFTTALSFGWVYLMRIIPLFQLDIPSQVLVGVLGALFILMIFLWRAESKAVAMLSFIVIWPFFMGAIKYFWNAEEFFAMPWWQNTLAIGGALLLLLIYAVILNAIDLDEHPVTMWIAFAFFFGLTVGAYYLLRIVSPGFASTFAQCALTCVFALNISIDIGIR